MVAAFLFASGNIGFASLEGEGFLLIAAHLFATCNIGFASFWMGRISFGVAAFLFASGNIGFASFEDFWWG